MKNNRYINLLLKNNNTNTRINNEKHNILRKANKK